MAYHVPLFPPPWRYGLRWAGYDGVRAIGVRWQSAVDVRRGIQGGHGVLSGDAGGCGDADGHGPKATAFAGCRAVLRPQWPSFCRPSCS